MEVGVLETVEKLVVAGALKEVDGELKINAEVEARSPIGPGAASAQGFGKVAT